MWDIYNEPGQFGIGEISQTLLRAFGLGRMRSGRVNRLRPASMGQSAVSTTT